ncbi:MAG: metallophosphoesterase [Phycisphaerales bacterium]|nr:metallophosphoesterase [Phycisphaerales bacterium]
MIDTRAELISATIFPVRVAALSASRPRRILVLSDLHLPFGSDQCERLLQDRAFLDRHDWIVLLGDLVACYGTRGEYARVDAFLAALGRPYSVVNGNHEFYFTPVEEGTADYGRQFLGASRAVQDEQMARFERFYGLPSRFDAARWDNLAVGLVGLDGLGSEDEGLLSPQHQQWLCDVLDGSSDVPLLLFCHLPVFDPRLAMLRYYEAGRRPYMELSPAIRDRLRNRKLPTFWLSGHLHLQPEHPFFEPYRTDDGVIQVHCPDSRGRGRPDNLQWHCSEHDGLTVRSLQVDEHELAIKTRHLGSAHESSSRFSLTAVGLEPVRHF